ncbi:MAG: Asp-tRNA(Asn)/Glu-tRNA(Gln) amidotransferase subunit GatB [Nitrospirota bacterium]|mgnify:CR=1 FL=1
MEYETVIGLEIHAQLLTRSKIFCGCSTKFGEEPNTQVCPVCIGMPGVLPVLNKRAVDFAIKTALATKCAVNEYSIFARKNYFYPDLPKNYQISQYELPLAIKGNIEIVVDGNVKKVGITRIHMEEDAGKNLHEGIEDASHVDLNRTGVPLMEIVSEPDMRTPEEAVAYLKKLRDILRYLGVCDGNMEEGSFRCDANVSIRPVGQKELGTKAELKNMNSFKFVQKALEYEIDRQKELLEDGKRIIQETRLWDSNKGVTISMRSKEEAHDYRYFPEPDLVPLVINKDWIGEIRNGLPELPDAKRARFVKEYGLPEYDAELLTSTIAMADYFEGCVKLYNQPKAVSNWIMGDLIRELNENNIDIADSPVSPQKLTDMLKLMDKGIISGKIAKVVFEEMFKTSKDAEAIVQEKGLVQVTDESEIEKVIDEIIKANPDQLAEYRSGKDKLFGFFVGQVMKESKGKANPAKVNELLKKKLQ